MYCYARPGRRYLKLLPGRDFETRLIVKRHIAEVLRRELARPRYALQLLNISSVTGGYQPIERERTLTRAVLAVMQQTQHPFSLVTKSSGVERDLDLDLIAPMAANKLAAVYITITTLDSALSRKREPRAASPQRRLRTIRTLAEAGVPAGVSLAP